MFPFSVGRGLDPAGQPRGDRGFPTPPRRRREILRQMCARSRAGSYPAVQICVARNVPGWRNVPGRRTRRPYIYRKTGRFVVKTPRLPGGSCGGVKTPPYKSPKTAYFAVYIPANRRGGLQAARGVRGWYAVLRDGRPFPVIL